jgi:arylamine N-acetyltransferase
MKRTLTALAAIAALTTVAPAAFAFEDLAELRPTTVAIMPAALTAFQRAPSQSGPGP